MMAEIQRTVSKAVKSTPRGMLLALKCRLAPTDERRGRTDHTLQRVTKGTKNSWNRRMASKLGKPLQETLYPEVPRHQGLYKSSEAPVKRIFQLLDKPTR
jgi:hypothetical protein